MKSVKKQLFLVESWPNNVMMKTEKSHISVDI